MPQGTSCLSLLLQQHPLHGAILTPHVPLGSCRPSSKADTDEAAFNRFAYCVERRLQVALSDSDHCSAGVASASIRSMVKNKMKRLVRCMRCEVRCVVLHLAARDDFEIEKWRENAK